MSSRTLGVRVPQVEYHCLRLTVMAKVFRRFLQVFKVSADILP
jgi:hypothetical protein